MIGYLSKDTLFYLITSKKQFTFNAASLSCSFSKASRNSENLSMRELKMRNSTDVHKVANLTRAKKMSVLVCINRE
jgi:predicted helicase